ncbi:MAG: RecX family transcriptional regulator, partial [Candidatus Marinimicrobia bacterium]|nr:RecX family transcriptional regulator [Candidatus Neomarinimicrobiota bacterium]
IKRKGQKRSKRLLIFDDQSVFGISEDVFVSTGLEVGSEVDDEYLSELVIKENDHQAFHAAISLLNYRMRSKAELRKRLAEKGYETGTIDNAMQKLEEKKYVNDELFAKAFINDKIHSRYLGPVALRRELIPHRIDSELVEKLIQQAYNEIPEEELVERLMTKRNIQPGQKLTRKEKNRLLAYLQRRGHRWDIIKTVLDG